MHGGVRLGADGSIWDPVTRIALAPGSLADPARPEDWVALAGGQLARVLVEWRDVRAVLASCRGVRSTVPLRALVRAMRLRCEIPGTFIRGGLSVLRWTLVPATFVGTLMVAVALVAGGAVGAPEVALQAAGIAAISWWLSTAVHEYAHLWVMRLTFRDTSVGAITFCGPSVSVVGPAVAGPQAALIAVAGPLIGSSVCIALVPAVSQQMNWIPILLALVHLSNLLPVAPDGRLLLRWRNERASRSRAPARSNDCDSRIGIRPSADRTAAAHSTRNRRLRDRPPLGPVR